VLTRGLDRERQAGRRGPLPRSADEQGVEAARAHKLVDFPAVLFADDDVLEAYTGRVQRRGGVTQQPQRPGRPLGTSRGLVVGRDQQRHGQGVAGGEFAAKSDQPVQISAWVGGDEQAGELGSGVAVFTLHCRPRSVRLPGLAAERGEFLPARWSDVRVRDLWAPCVTAPGDPREPGSGRAR
jgi:hypothetical protein